ncbi:hypothetical protein ABTB61_19460, partial [Acinetobacter baumannii]
PAVNVKKAFSFEIEAGPDMVAVAGASHAQDQNADEGAGAMQRQAPLAADRSDGGTGPLGRSHTLDVLRGLAIVGVMAVHVSQSFP